MMDLPRKKIDLNVLLFKCLLMKTLHYVALHEDFVLDR